MVSKTEAMEHSYIQIPYKLHESDVPVLNLPGNTNKIVDALRRAPCDDIVLYGGITVDNIVDLSFSYSNDENLQSVVNEAKTETTILKSNRK